MPGGHSSRAIGGEQVKAIPGISGAAERAPAARSIHADQGKEQVRGFGLERDVADFVELCGYPHSSTYADLATMPRVCVVRL
jgi:hypothetical protein